VSVVRPPPRFLMGAVEEGEIAAVDGEDHVGVLDLEFLVLAKAGQTSRVERLANFARPFLAVETAHGAEQIAAAHQRDQDIGVLAGPGHGDVEMRDPPGDIGDDFLKLRLSIRAIDAGGEHAHRPIVLSDAVDAAGQVIFGAERDLEEADGDFTVGEGFLFGALARSDGGDFGE